MEHPSPLPHPHPPPILLPRVAVGLFTPKVYFSVPARENPAETAVDYLHCEAVHSPVETMLTAHCTFPHQGYIL